MSTIFLMFENPIINGEAAAVAFRNQVVVLSYSWGMSRDVLVTSTGLTQTGAAEVQHLSIRKNVDRATPELMRRCLTGAEMAGPVTLTVRVAGAGGQQYNAVQLILTNVVVASVSAGAAREQDDLTEEVTLAFREFSYTYNMEGGNSFTVRHSLAQNRTD